MSYNLDRGYVSKETWTCHEVMCRKRLGYVSKETWTYDEVMYWKRLGDMSEEARTYDEVMCPVMCRKKLELMT